MEKSKSPKSSNSSTVSKYLRSANESNTPIISQIFQYSNEEIQNILVKKVVKEEKFEIKPNINELSRNNPKQNQSGTLDEEPMPLNLTYYQCVLCNKKYRLIEDVTKHLTIFHKIGSEFQKDLIKSGSFC